MQISSLITLDHTKTASSLKRKTQSLIRNSSHQYSFAFWQFQIYPFQISHVSSLYPKLQGIPTLTLLSPSMNKRSKSQASLYQTFVVTGMIWMRCPGYYACPKYCSNHESLLVCWTKRIFFQKCPFSECLDDAASIEYSLVLPC